MLVGFVLGTSLLNLKISTDAYSVFLYGVLYTSIMRLFTLLSQVSEKLSALNMLDLFLSVYMYVGQNAVYQWLLFVSVVHIFISFIDTL